MFKEAIRKILLRMLIWTEKKPITQKVRRKIPFWRREIHIPAGIIVTANVILVFTVGLLEIDLAIVKLTGLLLMSILLAVLFIILYKKYLPELSKDNNAIMLTGILIFGFVLLISAIKSVEVISPFAIPVAGLVLLTTILLDDLAGLLLSVLISFICAFVYQFKLEYFFYHLVSSIVAAHISGKITHRQDITSAGGKIALISIISIVVLTLSDRIQFNILNIVWGLINGIASAIIVLGLLSPLETFFSRITNIKLIELADFNQPLLKRLMVEAPGTYHHSLTVATIAEQCSQLVSGNSLLVRVGAFYHDIGKLIKPEYFIENQLSMENPHDFILPSMSGLVIISHVKEGVNLARMHNLDKPIINLIEQHHGTSLIQTIYQKALDEVKETKEESFRYPGPKPKTKESAILLIADSCEAAVRTLAEGSPAKIKDIVEKIIDDKFRDGQLDDAPLSLKDMHKIANSIITTLTSIHHARIEYEESQPNE